MNDDHKTYLGIDWGEKRIGLAIGNDATRMASPFAVAGSVAEVLRIIETEGVDELVIGEPLKMRTAAQEFIPDYHVFMEKIRAGFGGPIHKLDERLSSRHADSLSGSKKTKAPRDAVAAMLILQDYLDRLA